MLPASSSMDKMIKHYVDRIFASYDRNRSGTLEARELQHFLNDMFIGMGSPQRVSKEEAQRAIASVDLNGDGLLDKAELVLAFKNLYYHQDMRLRHPTETPPHQEYPQTKLMKESPQQQVRPMLNKNICFDKVKHQGIYDIPEPYHGTVHHKPAHETQNAARKKVPPPF